MLEKEEKRCENRWRNIEKDVARQGKYRRAKNSQGKSKKVLTFRKAVLYYTQKVKESQSVIFDDLKRYLKLFQASIIHLFFSKQN